MPRALTFLCFALLPSLLVAKPAMPDYQQWQAACAMLPSNRQLDMEKKDFPDKDLLPLPKFTDFEELLDEFLRVTRQGPLAKPDAWVGRAPDAQTFFDESRTWYGDKSVPFEPFAAKVVLPENGEAILLGDLHGDVRSLLKTLESLNSRGFLDGFKVRDPKNAIIFLGDFADRGHYGVEVLYTIFRLKIANPDQVHVGRGNHEDYNIVSRYGFIDEVKGKYGDDANITKVMRTYDRMPVVTYVGTGTDFLQMNHGGMEPGFNPRDLVGSADTVRFQLLGELRQKKYHDDHQGWLGDDPQVLALAGKQFRDFTPISMTSPSPIGFLWNDFTVFSDEPVLSAGRPLVFGPGPTRHILDSASAGQVRVRGVVRAHQHLNSLNPLMSRLVASDGVFRHWQESETLADKDKSVADLRARLLPADSRPIPDGSVWTLNVSPDSVFGTGCGYDFASAGILKVSSKFEDWRMSVLKVAVF